MHSGTEAMMVTEYFRPKYLKLFPLLVLPRSGKEPLLYAIPLSLYHSGQLGNTTGSEGPNPRFYAVRTDTEPTE